MSDPTQTEAPPQTDSPTKPPDAGLSADAAPETAPPAAQPEPDDGAPPTDGGEPGAEPKEEKPPPSWASISDVAELLDHEEIAPRVQEVKDAAYGEGKAENRRIQAFVQDQQRQLKSIDEKADEFVRSWNETVEGGTLDADTVRKLRRDNSQLFEAMSGVHLTTGRWAGIGQVVANLGHVLKSQDFAQEFGDRVGQLRDGLLQTDETFFEDMVQTITKEAKKPLQEEIKELKAEVVRLETDGRTAKRKEQQPPAEPPGTASGGGGKDASEIIRDPKSTPEQKQEAFRRKHGIDLEAVAPIR